MIIIAHRACIQPDRKRENTVAAAEEAFKFGLHVEVDVWYWKKQFKLGHDSFDHDVTPEFLLRPDVWCHAKNPDAMFALKELGAHYFWHEDDDYTLTSRGFAWVYPGMKLGPNCVCVHPERSPYDYSQCYAVCTKTPLLALRNRLAPPTHQNPLLQSPASGTSPNQRSQ